MSYESNLTFESFWYEIKDPKTKKFLFFNTETGKRRLKPPKNYHKFDENQCWELFDFSSHQFYYYFVKSGICSWIKPENNKFISLIKYQYLKEKKLKIYADKSQQVDAEFDLEYPGVSRIDESASKSRLDNSNENIETSGYSTIHSGHTRHVAPIPQHMSSSSVESLDMLVTATPMIHTNTTTSASNTMRMMPRTNPHYMRSDEGTLRLSKPYYEEDLPTNGKYLEADVNPNKYEDKEDVYEKIGKPSTNCSQDNDSLIMEDFTDDDEEATSSPQNFASLTRASPLISNKDTPYSLPSSNEQRMPRKSVISAITKSAGSQNIFSGSEIWSRDLFSKSDKQLAGLMSWSKKSIADTLLATTPKAYKRKAIENFKQIQMYMGDRDMKVSKVKLAYAICRRGCSSSAWANEIIMQLCKQVTYNPNSEHTFYGWELICICLKFFYPDNVTMQKSFEAFLQQYCQTASPSTTAVVGNNISPGNNSTYIDYKSLDFNDHLQRSIFCARIALKLLAMHNKTSSITVEMVMEAKQSYGYPTVFHSTLDEVMDLQSNLYPKRKLPWIIVALTEEIIRCNGTKTQGIMRVPSEQSKIETLTQAIEKAFRPYQSQDGGVNFDIVNAPSVKGCDALLHKLLSDNNLEHDPLLLSSVLKNWLRHMPCSIIPFEEFMPLSSNNQLKNFNKIIPHIECLAPINYLVFQYLIKFLQILGSSENVAYTNMPVENLVTLMAPTLFKLEINELQPAMQLLHTLVTHWNTDSIIDVR